MPETTERSAAIESIRAKLEAVDAEICALYAIDQHADDYEAVPYIIRVLDGVHAASFRLKEYAALSA